MDSCCILHTLLPHGCVSMCICANVVSNDKNKSPNSKNARHHQNRTELHRHIGFPAEQTTIRDCCVICKYDQSSSRRNTARLGPPEKIASHSAGLSARICRWSTGLQSTFIYPRSVLPPCCRVQRQVRLDAYFLCSVYRAQ